MIQRTEQIRIGKSHPYYRLLDGFCFASKNLYNQALYRVRQYFCSEKGYLNYYAIDASFKADNELNNSDYRNMPTAASAQQTLMLLHRNWVSFFNATKAYNANPETFTGKPRLPKYLDKDKGRQVVILPGQTISAKNGVICFPKTFNGFELKFRHNDVPIRQVRFIPKENHIMAEIIYQLEEANPLTDNGRYFGIDLGISNFATIVSNVIPPVIINGGQLKAINQYYNKQNAQVRAVETAIHPMLTPKGSMYCKQTNRLRTLTTKRNARIKDGLHKISRHVADLAAEHEIARIIVGKNDGWKQGVNLGKKTNQSFTQLPHARFIAMLTYKAKAVGIEVITCEESYTSKTGHLDGEQPIKYEIYRGKRVQRGLFRTADGTTINADVNGAAQIMRKVVPMAKAYGIEGGVNPVKVAIA